MAQVSHIFIKSRIIIYFRLILVKPPKSLFGTGRKQGINSVNSAYLRIVAMQAIFIFVFVSSLFSIARTAHASISSFVSSLLFESVNSQEFERVHINSQNTGLEPVHGQKTSLGNGDVVIVDETALESQDENFGESITYPQGDQISVYVVHKGDTLSQIAKMYGVSVNTILWANDITSGVISEGQTLTILPISGVKYIVKKGDTIQSITKKHGGDLKEVLQFNNLEADANLNIGDEIIIPDGETAPSINSGNSSSQSKPATKTTKVGKFNNLPVITGYYTRPLVGGRKTQNIHGYNGVDLANTTGSQIFASAAGKVIVSKNSGWNGGYGNYVVILHDNGTQTVYGHLKQSIVFVGQFVAKGQVIGYLGSTGRSTGPHLHFEVRGARNPF